MVFFSAIRGRHVFDSEGKKLGVLKDFIFVDGEKCAEISHLIYVTDEKKRKKISWSFVKELKEPSERNKNIDIYLNAPASKISFEVEKDRELLASWLLDKQLIDTDGLRIVRVNDVLLGKIENKFCIVAVDVGSSGLMRRLGIEGISSRVFKNMQDHIITWEYVEPCDEEMSSLKVKVQRSKIADMHPADIADIMEDLSSKERALIFNSLDNKTAAQAIVESEPEVQQSVFRTLKSKRITEILESMPPDEAADILGEMQSSRCNEILDSMKPEAAERVRKLLQYNADVAGGLMSPDFITIPHKFTAEQTINKMRELAPNTMHAYYVYVCDEEKLVGIISLRDLVVAPPDKRVADFMRTDIVSVNVHTHKKEIYKAMNKYNLLVLPVVDLKGKMVGVISADDVIEDMIPDSLRRQRVLVKRSRKRKKKLESSKNGN